MNLGNKYITLGLFLLLPSLSIASDQLINQHNQTTHQFVTTLSTYIKHNRILDVVLLINIVASDQNHLIIVEDFIKNLLAPHITEETRLAILTYNTNTTIHFNNININTETLPQYKCQLLDQITNAFESSTNNQFTNTYEALKTVENILKNSRKSSNKLILLITSNSHNIGSPPASIAHKLQAMTWDDNQVQTGVTIFSLGLEGASLEELKSVSTDLPFHASLIQYRSLDVERRRLYQDKTEKDWMDVTPTNSLSIEESRTFHNGSIKCGRSVCRDKLSRCVCGRETGEFACTCDLGYENVNSLCKPCRKGSYKDTLHSLRCKECPQNTTTLHAAAKHVSDCVPLPGFSVCEPAPEVDNAISYHVSATNTYGKVAPTGVSCREVTDGGSCFYQCNEGYSLHGSPFIRCMRGGVWKGKKPSCQMIECQKLPQNKLDQWNIDATYINGTRYGSLVHVTCSDESRVVIGSSYWPCTKFGVWKKPDNFQCKEVFCSKLEVPAYSKVMEEICNASLVPINTSCSIKCGDGFILERPTTYKCVFDGKTTWKSTHTPYCKDIKPPLVSCLPEVVVEEWRVPKEGVYVETSLEKVKISDNTGSYRVKIEGLPPNNMFKLGSTVLTYRAYDASNHSGLCRQTIKVSEKKVRVLNCPENQTLQINREDRKVEVRWNKPRFEFTNGSEVGYRCSLESGTLLQFGHHIVRCHANAYPNSFCQFDVNVEEPICEEPSGGVLNGQLKCKRSHGVFVKSCTLECLPGYETLPSASSSFDCDWKGAWNVPFPWPDCYEIRKKDTEKCIVDIVFEDSEGTCDFDKDEILQQVNEKIKNVAESLKSDYSDDVEELKMVDWYVNCTKVDGRRRKRSLEIDNNTNMSNDSIIFGNLSTISDRMVNDIKNVSIENFTESNSTNSQPDSYYFNDQLISLLKDFLVKGLNQMLISDKLDSKLEYNSLNELHATTTIPTNSTAKLSQETRSINITNQQTISFPIINITTTRVQEKLFYSSSPSSSSVSSLSSTSSTLSSSSLSSSSPPSSPSSSFFPSSSSSSLSSTSDNIDRGITSTVYLDETNDNSDTHETYTTEDTMETLDITYTSSIDTTQTTTKSIQPATSNSQDITSTSTIKTVNTTQVVSQKRVETSKNENKDYLINKEKWLSSDKRQLILHIVVELKYQDKAKYITTSQMEPISQLFDFYLEDNLLQDDWQIDKKALQPSFDECSLHMVENDLTCSNGEQNIKSACYKCVQGTFFNGTTCNWCPHNTYQDSPASTSCIPCLQNTITLYPKSRTKRDCLAECSAGFYSSQGREPCVACPIGTFQDKPGQKECLTCPKRTSTVDVASTSQTACIGICGVNEESKNGLQPCTACAMGFYQPETFQTFCVKCPSSIHNSKAAFPYCPSSVDCKDHNITCNNKGSCLEWLGQIKCDCKKGYKGDDCELEVNECDEVECLNNGKCTDHHTYFECQCPPEFSGKLCEKDVDECQKEGVCLNGGTCLNSYGGYQCLCAQGFTGNRCEEDVDECVSVDCGGGTCVDGVDFFSCSCPPTLTGALCDVSIDICSLDPCLNGATCVIKDASRVCVCPINFTGVNCELEVGFCADNPCGPNATCISSNDGYHCICPLGFSDKNCSKKVSPKFDLVFHSNGGFATLATFKSFRELSVCVWIRSTDTRTYGTIWCYLQNDACKLSLYDYGDLKLKIGDQRENLGLALNNGDWHFVCVSWHEDEAKWNLAVNGTFQKSGKTAKSAVSLQNGIFVLGQDFEDGVSKRKSFYGEMSGFVAHDEWRNSSKFGDYYKEKCEVATGGLVGWTGVVLGGDVRVREQSLCQDIDKCSTSEECSPDEACLPLNNIKTCQQCTQEIYDKNPECHSRDVACTSNPCQNNGVCTNTLKGSYKCHCMNGFYGKTCEYKEDFKSCNEELCVHGRCEHVSVDKVRCSCIAGWTGARCQTLHVTACKNDSCPAGYICQSDGDTLFHCLATPLKLQLYKVVLASVILFVVFIAVILITVFCCIRSQRKKKNREASNEIALRATNPFYTQSLDLFEESVYSEPRDIQPYATSEDSEKESDVEDLTKSYRSWVSKRPLPEHPNEEDEKEGDDYRFSNDFRTSPPPPYYPSREYLSKNDSVKKVFIGSKGGNSHDYENDNYDKASPSNCYFVPLADNIDKDSNIKYHDKNNDDAKTCDDVDNDVNDAYLVPSLESIAEKNDVENENDDVGKKDRSKKDDQE